MNKKAFFSLIMTFTLLLTILPFAMAAPEPPVFTDVPAGHTAKASIDYCVANGFLKGNGNGTFTPDNNITRAQFVTVWARTFNARVHSFNDATKPKNEIDNAIILMYGLGHINGISASEFSHNTPITREQVAKIVQNTYLKGIESNDEYTSYSDKDDVSVWAKDAVSVCKAKGIFDDVTKDGKFEPQKAITRAEVCLVIHELMKVEYDITIAPMTNGTVTANKSKAEAGQTVELTVDPTDDYRLKAGTLKYNGIAITGTSFEMPAANVTITAEFEEDITLKSIVVKDMPSNISFDEGDNLDLTGLTLTATYSDDNTETITTGFTTDPADGSVLNEDGEITITVYYSYGGVEKTTSFTITVDEVA